MSRVILWGSQGMYRAFLPHRSHIGLRLRQVTVAALNLKGPEEVAFTLAAPLGRSSGNEEIQLICIASEQLTPDQIIHWRNTLGVAWAAFADDEELADIAPLFLKKIEVCPAIPVGERGVFQNGKLLRD